jgi:hypothetical protein
MKTEVLSSAWHVTQVTPLEVDNGLLAICSVVAEVKGWTMEQAARTCLSNFKEFYKEQLEAAAAWRG